MDDKDKRIAELESQLQQLIAAVQRYLTSPPARRGVLGPILRQEAEAAEKLAGPGAHEVFIVKPTIFSVVKSASDEAWSGSARDPEFPALGHVCVRSLSEAHRFDDIAEALEEAYTYRGGAYIMQGAVVAETGPW